MKKVKLAAFLLATCIVAHSDDITLRENVIRASHLSYVEGIKPGFIWLSTISVESKPAYLSNSSGKSIMTIPLTVVSAYDSTSTRYDVSNLYALKNERMKLIAHANGFTKGEVFSFGFDSGVKTEKLKINSSIFIGFVKSFSLSQFSLFNISAGSWFGGEINESPCLDSYDRQYYCPSLTAWSEYTPIYPSPQRFIDLKYIWIF